MTATASTPEGRFLNRVERRAAFLKILGLADYGIYLAPDPHQRKRSIEMLVRLIARQSELPHLSADALARAAEIFTRELEAMQKSLPHDVQYRNRLKKDW
ncbi:MAG: hypothetical protein JNK52_07270 [Zoogloeaceae bacterium]|nr:hypothetical protein [Zoogloeaceae bacterium]